jgi:LexA-binding, inner membrane-associated putative hydrolase
MIFGHLAIAGIAKRKFLEENFIFLFAASFGPDLIDKTLYVAFDAPGRGVGHSLLIFALVTAAGWFYCQRFKLNKHLVYIGAVLWLSHLTADLVDLRIFFWPLLGPFPVFPPSTLMERLSSYYLLHNHPVQLAAEITLILIALLLWLPHSFWSRLRSLAHTIGVEGR